jgi:hypothetical protein
MKAMKAPVGHGASGLREEHARVVPILVKQKSLVCVAAR